jgi:hypothetical protein
MATWVHLLISKFLLRSIWAYLDDHDVGHAGPAPLFVRLWDKQFGNPISCPVFTSTFMIGPKFKMARIL